MRSDSFFFASSSFQLHPFYCVFDAVFVKTFPLISCIVQE